MKIKIKELELDYTTINLRATELESYYNCAFKFKYGKNQYSNNDALLFGTMMHACMQSYFFDPKKGLDTLEILCMQHQERCGDIFKYLTMVDGQELLKKYNVISTEYKNVIEIEYGKYLIIFEGTIDAVCKDQFGNYRLIDFKTSKAERTPEDYEGKLQKIIYTWMFSKLVGEDKVESFDYLIFTKHKKPRFQSLEYKPDRATLDTFMIGLVSDYANSVETNVRNSKAAKHCFRCKLKESCPSHAKQSDEF